MSTTEGQKLSDEYRDKCAELAIEMRVPPMAGFAAFLGLIIALEPEIAKEHGIPTDAMADITGKALAVLREKSLSRDEESGILAAPE